MRWRFSRLVQELAPPFFLRGAKRVYQSAINRRLVQHVGRQRDAQWYDDSFEAADHWHRHYTASHYYFLWSVIVDRLRQAGVQTILDIGCGAGQLASLLRDQGIPHYIGLDFSRKRIQAARSNCPGYEFHQADAFATDLYDTVEYDAVLCTEFLEHVDQDLEVLEKIRPGTFFLGTVPNFPYTSHVRHFQDRAEVEQRYREAFDGLQVTSFLANTAGKTFFLLQGTIGQNTRQTAASGNLAQ